MVKKINYKNYGKKECRKSLAWTNKTRKAVNAEWMLKESKGKTCYLINNCKVFVGLPVIANETRTFKQNIVYLDEKTNELKKVHNVLVKVHAMKAHAEAQKTEINYDSDHNSVFNNEEFEVFAVDKDSVTLTNTRITISIKHSEFKFIDLAHCITVHK